MAHAAHMHTAPMMATHDPGVIIYGRRQTTNTPNEAATTATASQSSRTNGQANGASTHRSSIGGPPMLMGATPEDRQKAVAKLLSRGESFSLSQEEAGHGYELTPDESDLSPSSSPRHSNNMMMASSAPEISFTKQEVAPVQPAISGLTGLHRPSMDGRPVIQTPDRYAIAVPPPRELSHSGRRKAGRFKCSVFLPLHATPCMQLDLKAGSTAAQAVIHTLQEYLRTHTQPAPAMLGQPASYRLYLAEDDGELDDSFPPLDPTCVVSSTGADCFLLQKHTQRSASSSVAVMPAAASLSDLRGVTAAPVPSGASGRRAPAVMSALDENHSQFGHSDGGFGDLDSDADFYAHRSSPPRDQNASPLDDGEGGSGRSGGGRAASTRKGQRTSSDAEEFGDSEGNGNQPRAGGTRGSNVGSGSDASTAPPKRTKSFSTFSFRSCIQCACFKSAPDEEEPIEPHEEVDRRHSIQGE